MYRLSKIGLIVFMLAGGFTLSLFGGQIEVLEDLYSQTGGDKWSHNDNWLNGEDPCNSKIPWYGITCEGSEVIKIELGVNNLVGTIPASLGSLQSLQVLRFNSNGLTGKIPDDLGNLYATLIWLDVNNNNLDGSINFVTKLENLLKLNMYNNNFSGLIPSNIGDLNKLTELDLGKNQFTGTIPTSIGGLTSAIGIWLNNNELTGAIPNSLTSLNNNLYFLKLNDNQLFGIIPSGFKDTSLDWLELARNCDLYSDDQSLISYLNTLPSSTYEEILNSNKCPSNHTQVNMAPIIAYLLSDSTPPPPVPSEPYNVQATPVNMTSDKMNITWTDASNNENGFHIYRSNAVDGSKVKISSVGTNVTSFQDSGLSGCREYFYWVKAYNSGGLSSYSESANAETAPAAPTGLYTTNYVIRSTTLYWDNNVDSGCTVRYHVYAKYPEDSSYTKIDDNNDLMDGTVGNTNVDIQPETYIYYRVVAENSDGISGSMSCEVKNGYRNTLAESANTLCKAAVGYAFNDESQYPWASTDRSSEVLFTWDDVPLQYSSDGTSVELYANCFEIKYRVGTGIWNEYTDCLQNPFQSNGWQYQAFTVNQVAADTTISLSISTHYLYNGEHVYSNPIIISGKTLPSGSSGSGTDTLGSAPWITTSSYYPGKIMIGWGIRDAATQYDIYRAVYNSVSCSSSSYISYRSFTSGSRFDDNVGNWKEYCYKVRACNAAGCTDLSYGEYGSSGGGI